MKRNEGQPVVLRHENHIGASMRALAWCTAWWDSGQLPMSAGQCAATRAGRSRLRRRRLPGRAQTDEAAVTWHVTDALGLRRKLQPFIEQEFIASEQIERAKTSGRAKVEHPFRDTQAAVQPQGSLPQIAKQHRSSARYSLGNLWMAGGA